MFRRDQRTLIDGMDHTATAEERFQVDAANCRDVDAVVERRIGMRAKMRRHGDSADVDRTARSDLRVPPLLVRRVARKARRRVRDRRRNIPESLHCDTITSPSMSSTTASEEP